LDASFNSSELELFYMGNELLTKETGSSSRQLSALEKEEIGDKTSSIAMISTPSISLYIR
jgi:hypothetical protein